MYHRSTFVAATAETEVMFFDSKKKRQRLGEIAPLAIERFKSQRQHSFTKYDKQRSPASVNRELELLSRIFSLAVRLGLAEFNPCSRVSRFKLQNQRHRYLLPDEEPALL